MKKVQIYIYIFLAISSKSRFETRISIYNILKEEITFNCHFFYLQSILDKKKRKRRISNKNILFTYIAFDYPLTKKKNFYSHFCTNTRDLIVVSRFEWYCLLLQFPYLFIRWYLRAGSNGRKLFSTRFVHCKLFRPLFNRGLSTQLKFTLNARLFHSAHESCPAQSRAYILSFLSLELFSEGALAR